MSVKCIVSCPISTYSGYGGRSRDFVRALIENYPDWDIKILPNVGVILVKVFWKTRTIRYFCQDLLKELSINQTYGFKSLFLTNFNQSVTLI